MMWPQWSGAALCHVELALEDNKEGIHKLYAKLGMRFGAIKSLMGFLESLAGTIVDPGHLRQVSHERLVWPDADGHLCRGKLRLDLVRSFYRYRGPIL